MSVSMNDGGDGSICHAEIRHAGYSLDTSLYLLVSVRRYCCTIDLFLSASCALIIVLKFFKISNLTEMRNVEAKLAFFNFYYVSAILFDILPFPGVNHKNV